MRADTETESLLLSFEPTDVARACRAVVPKEIERVELTVPKALSGSRAAALGYLEAFEGMVGTTARLLRKYKSLASEDVVDMVTDQAAAAPFDIWVPEYGAGLGVALYVVEQLRPGGLHHVASATPPEGASMRGVRASSYRSFREFIEGCRRKEPVSSVPLLERVATLFGLNDTELAELFGVTRQAIRKWRDGGIPGERQAKLATLYALAELLAKNLNIGALPGIVRNPADDYGGQTMLQMIAAERLDDLFASAREAFDYSSAA